MTRTATAATAAAPAPATGAATPAPARRPPPPLRVVGPGELSAPARRRRARLRAVSVLVLVGAALFGLVASHVVLTQGQFRLERVRARAAAEEARYERLRLQVAELESPARIVTAAQQRLGMVAPRKVTYLPAPPSTRGPDPGPSAGAGGRRPAPRQGTGTQAWSQVKRHLASRP